MGAIAGAAWAWYTGDFSVLAGAAGGAAVGNTVDQQDAMKQAAEEQAKANKAALEVAGKQADLADQAMNKANPRNASVDRFMSESALSAKGGQSGTMLTGPHGVDPGALLLGRKTLLGA